MLNLIPLFFIAILLLLLQPFLYCPMFNLRLLRPLLLLPAFSHSSTNPPTPSTLFPALFVNLILILLLDLFSSLPFLRITCFFLQLHPPILLFLIIFLLLLHSLLSLIFFLPTASFPYRLIPHPLPPPYSFMNTC